MAKLRDFELTDQEAKKRVYRFPKTKVTVMTVADRIGCLLIAVSTTELTLMSNEAGGQTVAEKAAHRLTCNLGGITAQEVWTIGEGHPSRATAPIISKTLPVATPRHRLEAYATLTPSRVAVGARNSPQEAFRKIARHSGEQCSIGFQPVFRSSECGRQDDRPRRTSHRQIVHESQG
jgi:hypothetical protein